MLSYLNVALIWLKNFVALEILEHYDKDDGYVVADDDLEH
jgi:hypothetical protein